MEFIDIKKKIHSFDILFNIPFSSERKSMGIILKNRETDEIVYFIKGADSVI